MGLSRWREVAPPAVKTWYRSKVVPFLNRRQARRTSAFGALVSERKRWMFEALPPDVAAYQYDLFTKESQRRLAARLGLPMADVYLAGAPLDVALDHVETERLDRFVIKPDSSHNSIGFRALVRTADGFRNLRTGQVRRIDQVRSDLMREYAGRGRPDAWDLEELLVPPDGAIAAIEDFKFYCFGGRTELIFHGWKLTRKPWKRRMWYSRDWEPVTPSLKRPNHTEHRVPANAARLLEFAEHAAGQLAHPFMRVDLYDTSRGVLLGEFTHGPGGRHSFTPEWDARLADLWRKAAADVSEGVRSGRIRPLGPEPEPIAAD